MEFKHVVENRRAVNFFDPDKQVPDSMLKQMIEMAALSPSSFNLQPWNILVVKTPDDKARLRKLAFDQPKVTEAPVVLILLADRLGWQGNHPTFEKNFSEMQKAGSITPDKREWLENVTQNLYGASDSQQMAFACKNTGFFSMSLMLAAKSLGLDTHPMDGFDHEAVRAAFNIPDQYWIPVLLAVGYFNTTMTMGPKKWRKTYDEIVVQF
ncbi:MAG: nitroreductase family protein [Desulfobacterales bacterium]|nr:nitroreductase family protein [Desulfobacterales bacterium]